MKALLIGGPDHGEVLALPDHLRHYVPPADPNIVYTRETMLGVGGVEPRVEVFVAPDARDTGAEQAWRWLVEKAGLA